jgi:rod shape-determining protein MreC
MPLGTIDRTPPPFFRQGASALTKLIVCAGLALLLMVADARYAMVDPMRAAVATLLLPFQRALLTPVDAWEAMTDYTQGLESAVAQERASRARLAAQAIEAARAQVLEQENRRLRALLDLQPTLSVKSQAAEVLYEAADPFSRKAFINRGQTHGVLAGSPVINERGVLGQITRVYPLTSEVTLLVDRDATLPVLNARNQVRSAAFGGAAHPGMELRFMATNADVQVGDLLTTSGIDGVYPPGLSVAKVVSVERQVESGFARILAAPVSTPEGVRHVLVLEPLSVQMPPRPATSTASAPVGRSTKGTRR